MNKHLDNELLDTLTEAQKVEEQWLASIKAPVKRLPRYVAEAVAERVFLSSMPVEFTRYLCERINFNRIMKQIR